MVQVIRFDPATTTEEDESATIAVALSDCAVACHSSQRVVVAIGAGVSTAAGIRDFRSKDGGVNASQDVEGGNSFSSPGSSSTSYSKESLRLFHSSVYRSQNTRARHWKLMAQLHQQIASIQEQLEQPATITHELFGLLKRMGKLQRVYSQNIDGLEATAGLEFVLLPGVTPERTDENFMERSNSTGTQDILESCTSWKNKISRGNRNDTEEEVEGDVVQLHGSLHAVRCTVCDYVLRWKEEHTVSFLSGKMVDCPRCQGRVLTRASQFKRAIPCNSFLRPSVVLYDEPAASSSSIGYTALFDLEANPDLLLVFGTSLKIPGFKLIVKQFAKVVRSNHGLCIFVNLEEVSKEWDDVFDYHIQAKCDDFTHRIISDWFSSCPEAFSHIRTVTSNPLPKI